MPDALQAGLVGLSCGRTEASLQKLSSAPRALARLQYEVLCIMESVTFSDIAMLYGQFGTYILYLIYQ